ncbi:MAG TPA: class I SAM-dependent methyltransferase [Nocardioidaceae bacterium]|nr:class I SAM-dependent methyltransferase [Nocardioidaceae bacterium]
MTDSTRTHHDYWDSFYASRESSSVPEEPSDFARWVAGRLRTGQPVVEFGFGTGRDSLWFARQGHTVTGYDFAESAVRKAQGRADAEEIAASFTELDLYDTAVVQVVAKDVAETSPEPALYGRFLIHSLEEAGRANLLGFARTALGHGGDLYLEFRTGQDRGSAHVFGDDHFRVYLDPDVVEREIEQSGGTVTHHEQGHGLAVYKSEDPHVARIVARWSA